MRCGSSSARASRSSSGALILHVGIAALCAGALGAPTGARAASGQPTTAQAPAGAPSPSATPSPSAAPAQPATNAGASTEEPGEEAGTAELSGANEAVFLQDWPRAVRLAYAAMAKTKPGLEKYESAQFVAATALEKLGLKQAAAELYLSVATQRRNPALLSRSLAGLSRLARRGVLDEDKLLRGVAIEAELSSLSPAVSDFLHYYRGLANLRQGYTKWAERDFTEVRPDTFYGRKVRLAQAVTLVKDGKASDALEHVDALLAAEEKRAEKRRLDRGEAPLEDQQRTEQQKRDTERRLLAVRVTSNPVVEARLVRARLLFEAGRFEEAIREYVLVGRTVESPAGEILMERAWAHFRSGAPHDSMGLLYALGAPSNRELFLPDQYVLRGLIYQRFCHFRAAKAAVADFRARYGSDVEALKDGRAPLDVASVARAATDMADIAPDVRILRELIREEGVLEKLAASLEEGGAHAQLAALYGVMRGDSEARAKRALEDGARRAAERLLEADEQANLLEYEVGVSIFRPIRDPSGKLRVRAQAEVVPQSGPRIYYPFDDEFWTDELPDMRFLIQDRCVE